MPRAGVRSKCGWSPFEGVRFRSRIAATPALHETGVLAHDLRERLGLQLLEHVRAVGLDRAWRQAQRATDVFVGEPFDDQPQHLAFAVGQQRVALACGAVGPLVLARTHMPTHGVLQCLQQQRSGVVLAGFCSTKQDGSAAKALPLHKFLVHESRKDSEHGCDG